MMTIQTYWCFRWWRWFRWWWWWWFRTKWTSCLKPTPASTSLSCLTTKKRWSWWFWLWRLDDDDDYEDCDDVDGVSPGQNVLRTIFDQGQNVWAWNITQPSLSYRSCCRRSWQSRYQTRKDLDLSNLTLWLWIDPDLADKSRSDKYKI